jgi:hypothetical protein
MVLARPLVVAVPALRQLSYLLQLLDLVSHIQVILCLEQKTKKGNRGNEPNIFDRNTKSSQFMNLSQYDGSHYEGNEEDREDVMLARSEL